VDEKTITNECDDKYAVRKKHRKNNNKAIKEEGEKSRKVKGMRLMTSICV